MWVRQDLSPISKPEVRVGLVGAGFVAGFHLKTLKSLPNVKLVGVADIIPERAEQRAQQFDIPRFHSSLEQLLEDEFDVLHITSPGPTHYELAMLALEADRHLMVEKPFTSTAQQADHVLAEAEKRGKRVLVDHSLLGDPRMTAGRKVIDSGRIGDVESVQVFRCGHPPARVPARPPYPLLADPFREVGVHALYCISSILGPIHDMHVQARKTGKHTEFELDEWSVSVECEKGLGHIHLSWNGPSQQVISVRGDRGQVRIDLSSGLVLTRTKWPGPKQSQLVINPLMEAGASFWQVFRRIAGYLFGRSRWYQGIHELIKTYYDCLVTGAPMPFDGEHTRNIVHWVEVMANEIEANSVSPVREANSEQVVTRH